MENVCLRVILWRGVEGFGGVEGSEYMFRELRLLGVDSGDYLNCCLNDKRRARSARKLGL